MATPSKDWISFKGSEIEFNGELFFGSAAVKLKNNLGIHVGKLADDGRKYVVRQIASRPFPNKRASWKSRRRTGFTARSIEAYHDAPNSLYAKVRVKPGLERPGAKETAQYPAERIPYIVMAVLETGKRGGSHQQRVRFDPIRGSARSRRVWVSGDVQGNQRPLKAFFNAARRMRQLAPQIRKSILLKHLD